MARSRLEQPCSCTSESLKFETTIDCQGIVLLAMGCMGGAGVHGTGEARRLVSEAATRCLDLGLHRA